MNLPQFSVRHPVIISILLVVLAVFGTIAYQGLNREMVPSAGLPQANIITVWPGAGVEDMEETITRPIENQLSTLGGLSLMTSTSRASVSIVSLEFNDGTDVFSRLPEIRELLNSISDELPDEIQGPPEILISEADTLIPVFSFQIDTPGSPRALEQFIDDEISPRLARISGVARINVIGAPEEQIRVTLDPDLARAREITPLEVVGAITQGNRNIPAGELRFLNQELSMTTEGALRSLDELRNMVVGGQDGAFVTLADIARVERYLAEPSIRVRSGGTSTMMVDLLKRDTGNTLDIVAQAEATMNRIAREHPGMFTWQTVSDQREMTERSINTVITSALLGTLLATVVMLLFLRDLRATVIIALSIPISMLSAAAMMNVSGQTLNLLTLSGITVAVGMIVDASIVTLENTWTHFHRTGDAAIAAERGASEVSSAIIASTLTSVSVFLPLVFLDGIIGIIMQDLALTIVYALIAAAVVALVVVPFLSNRLLSSRVGKVASSPMEPMFFQRFRNWYNRVLPRALDNPRFVLVLAGAIFFASILLLTTVSVSFLAPTDTGEFEIHLETPRNFSLDETAAVVDEIDAILRELVPEIEAAVFYVGTNSALALTSTRNRAFGRIRLHDGRDRTRSIQNLIPLIQDALDTQITQGSVTVLNGGLDALMALATSGQGFQMQIFGTRLEDVVAVAEVVREQLSRDRNVRKAETNVAFDQEQLFLTLSHERMGRLGVQASDAGLTARILTEGVVAGSFIGEERIPIRVRSTLADEIADTQTVHRMFLRNRDGVTLSFASFADLAPRQTVSTINKRDRTISATVRGFLIDEDQSGVTARMETFMTGLDLPEGISWGRAGTSELIFDSARSLIGMLGLAIFLVYVVMVIQFERYRQPLIIMAAVPFALIGVVVGLLLFRSSLSIIAMLGLITLGGTVVNNAIVMVDHINGLQNREGMPLREAIITGAVERLRPITMTTLTTLFAVLPMAFSLGDGSEIYAPLGQAIFGGLLSSTVITLFLIPVLYLLVEGGASRKSRGSRGTATGALVVLMVAGMLTGARGTVSAQETGTLTDTMKRFGGDLESLLRYDEPFAPGTVDENIGESAAVQQRMSALRGAEADAAGARAQRQPEVTLRTDAAWLANPPEGVTLSPGALGELPNIGPFPPQTVEVFPGADSSRIEAGVRLRQPLFTSGALTAGIDAARAGQRVASTQLAAQRHRDTIQVQAIGEQMRILRELYRVLQVQETVAEELVRITRESWRSGFIPEREYLNARLSREEVRLAVTETLQQLGDIEEELQRITGLSLEVAQNLSPALPTAQMLQQSEEELVRRLQGSSWELQILQEVTALRHAQTRLARAQGLLRPEVGLQVEATVTGSLEDLDTWNVIIGVGLTVPLFDGGRRSASTARATATAEQSTWEQREREEQLTATMRNSVRRLVTLQAQMDHTRAVLAVREREIRDAEVSVAAGAGGPEVVLQAVIKYGNAVATGYQHLSAYRQQMWEIMALLGD